VKRTHDRQPYVTFRLNLNNKEKITKLIQKGNQVLDITLGVMSLVGGLFTSIAAFASLIVGKLNGGEFATYIV
jgi:hypothetical protein